MSKKSKITKVLTEELRCSVCEYSWLMADIKIYRLTLQTIGILRLCQLCYSYERFVRDVAFFTLYNPYDMGQWTPRLVPKELFYCCKCKRNIMKRHRLSENPCSAVTVFSFIYYPLHSLCRGCLLLAVGAAFSHVAPEFCCLPNPSNTVTIVTNAYTMVRGREF